MLPEIIVSCEKAGLVYINDSFIGEVSNEAYQSFIGAGVFHLKYLPFSSEKIYAPLFTKISICDGVPVFDSPYIHIFNCKNNVFLLELCPPPLAGHTLPICLRFTVVDNRFAFSLIEQNCFYLVIEDEQKEFADQFFPLDFQITPSMETINLGTSSVILISDSTSHIYVFSKNNKRYAKALTLDADSYAYNDGYLTITKTTSKGHKIINSYMLKNDKIQLDNTSFNINHSPCNDIMTDFLECVKYGIEDRALSYISSDLSLTFEELREFLGEYTDFKKSPFDENAFALITSKECELSLLNRFTFEIRNKKIFNIEEL